MDCKRRWRQRSRHAKPDNFYNALRCLNGVSMGQTCAPSRSKYTLVPSTRPLNHRASLHHLHSTSTVSPFGSRASNVCVCVWCCIGKERVALGYLPRPNKYPKTNAIKPIATCRSVWFLSVVCFFTLESTSKLFTLCSIS